MAKISIFKCVKILSRFSFLAAITYENALKPNLVWSLRHTRTWWLSAVGPPPATPTVCSSGTSPSMQMLPFHREQTDWRSLQTADRNSWECIWGLAFQSTEQCWTVQLSANLLLHAAALTSQQGVYCCWFHCRRTVFLPSEPDRQDPVLTVQVRSVQTPDQTERGGRP